MKQLRKTSAERGSKKKSNQLPIDHFIYHNFSVRDSACMNSVRSALPCQCRFRVIPVAARKHSRPEKRHRSPDYHKRQQVLSVSVQAVACLDPMIVRSCVLLKALRSLLAVRLYNGATDLISKRADSLSYTCLFFTERLEDIALATL